MIVLVEAYAVYLEEGIALIPYTSEKKNIKLIDKWCEKLSIKYKKTKRVKYVEGYCLTHNVVKYVEYDCLFDTETLIKYYDRNKWEDGDGCHIRYTLKIEESTIIIHDEKHEGVLGEVNFKCHECDKGEKYDKRSKETCVISYDITLE